MDDYAALLRCSITLYETTNQKKYLDNAENFSKKIIKNYKTNKSLYIGEKVTITEHMIQTAMLAEKNNSSSSLICASLLHDYGHFILDDPDELVNHKKDGRHEEIGYQFRELMINSGIDHQIDPNRDQFDGDQFPHPAAEKFITFSRFPQKP